MAWVDPTGYPAETQQKPTCLRIPAQSRKYQRLTLLVSGLTLLAIIIYAILVYFQWTEMIAATDATQQAVHEARLSRQQAQKSLNATIDQFHSEQRPYVWTISSGVGSPEFVPSRQPNSRTGQVTWTWHYTNYGKTPAYNVRFRHFISIDGGPFVESYRATRQGSFGPPLPPTQDVIAEVISGPGVTPEQWTHATSLGGQGISIRMKIEYTDTYGVMYETGICLSRLNTGAISFCREGNYIK